MTFFTLEEATELLPRVGRLMRDAIDKRQLLSEKEQEYAEGLEQTSSNGHSAADKLSGKRQEIERLAEQVNELMAEINELGCVVKDLDMGLVDFPSLRGDQPINLCWRMGEASIRFWHSMDTGFANRQPL